MDSYVQICIDAYESGFISSLFPFPFNLFDHKPLRPSSLNFSSRQCITQNRE
jgi:hypothetical protein